MGEHAATLDSKFNFLENVIVGLRGQMKSDITLATLLDSYVYTAITACLNALNEDDATITDVRTLFLERQERLLKIGRDTIMTSTDNKSPIVKKRQSLVYGNDKRRRIYDPSFVGIELICEVNLESLQKENNIDPSKAIVIPEEFENFFTSQR